MNASHCAVVSGSGSRREFLKLSGQMATASALAGGIVPRIYAAGGDTIKLALVGCGGRGTGAVADAFATTGGPVKLYAMADLFEDRLQSSLKNLKEAHAGQGRRPAGAAVRRLRRLQEGDRLPRPGDVVLLTTHAAFRPMHFEYAVEQGRQRLHGEVVRDRRARRAPLAEGRRGVREEEPQGRRRLHVAALQGPAGDDPADPRRGHRRRAHPADLPRPRPGPLPAAAQGRQRAGLSAPAIPTASPGSPPGSSSTGTATTSTWPAGPKGPGRSRPRAWAAAATRRRATSSTTTRSSTRSPTGRSCSPSRGT